MKRLKQYYLILVILIGYHWQALYAEDMGMLNKEDHMIELIAPFRNKKVMSGTMTFFWRPIKFLDTLTFHIQQYEVTFWAKNRRFVKMYTVIPSESDQVVTLRFEDCRSIFKRHGKYYWQVTAVDAVGNRLVSEIRSFTIQVTQLQDRPVIWYHPYGVIFHFANRLRTPDYQAFLKSVYPTKHMKNYSDLALLFRQQRIGNHFLEFEEEFIVRSQIGIGFDGGMRFRMFQNKFLSLYPRGRAGVCWYATGIEKYSSLLYHAFLGCDLGVMPKGYLIFQGGWIPLYRVRYSEKESGPRTFLGKGWEIGVQITIPQTLLKPFQFIGIEFDFQRMPLSYHFSRIQDQYTGTVMKIQNLSIGYIFH